jgi:hypothetical protein
MEPIMHIVAIVAALVVAGCRLDPLVDDKTVVSPHLLPAGAEVPSAADNPELANTITLHDGLDDRSLIATGGVIPRGSGQSAGRTVRYWSFGPVTRAPSPIYEFFDEAGAPIEHPALVTGLPGDRGYSPVHTRNRVVVTSAYAGELITTADALADAIALGLVNDPEPVDQFIDSPIVLPDTRLEVGDAAPIGAELVYARGFVVGMFRFGGPRGVQPGGGLVPSRQVSFLREFQKGSVDAARPIFEATVPVELPGEDVTYSPVSVVVNVDLAPNVLASTIHDDEQLFTRNANGAISTTTAAVAQFQVTTSTLLLQLQFTEGEP